MEAHRTGARLSFPSAWNLDRVVDRSVAFYPLRWAAVLPSPVPTAAPSSPGLERALVSPRGRALLPVLCPRVHGAPRSSSVTRSLPRARRGTAMPHPRPARLSPRSFRGHWPPRDPDSVCPSAFPASSSSFSGAGLPAPPPDLSASPLRPGTLSEPPVSHRDRTRTRQCFDGVI